MAKKSNDLLVSELTAKYRFLADIDMKNHKGIRIEVMVYDEVDLESESMGNI